jgi:hypothetical protein
MRRDFPAATAIAMLAGCGADPAPGAAMAAFAEFQNALFAGDERRCRAALTTESAAALLEMPWHRVKEQQPLRVLGATRHQNGFRVQLSDPNHGDRPAEFVVVREYGRLVVDLVASAGLTAKTESTAGGAPTLVPRELTPADHDRIRQWQLAQPAR